MLNSPLGYTFPGAAIWWRQAPTLYLFLSPGPFIGVFLWLLRRALPAVLLLRRLFLTHPTTHNLPAVPPLRRLFLTRPPPQYTYGIIACGAGQQGCGLVSDQGKGVADSAKRKLAPPYNPPRGKGQLLCAVWP